MSWEVFAKVLGSIASAKSAFDHERTGGVGGATSAQTKGGQTGLQYQDVGGTEVPDFIWREYGEQLAEEEKQREMAEAMALA